jgi:hypothetical protein
MMIPRARLIDRIIGSLCCLLLCVTTARAQDEWISLFDGQSLKGWKANEHADKWQVVDGAIVAHSERSHLFYVGDDEAKPAEFTNFHLKAQVMTKPSANSGLFFHTKFQNDGWPEVGYEAQVNQTQGDRIKTGSIYNVVSNYKPPANDNEWFTYEIIVNGKSIETKVNGETVVAYTEPEGVSGTRKLSSGTFAIQAHDPGSEVHYKDIQVKRLP